jgi:hypothetical protein
VMWDRRADRRSRSCKHSLSMCVCVVWMIKQALHFCSCSIVVTWNEHRTGVR